jgi:hypothetical protein
MNRRAGRGPLTGSGTTAATSCTSGDPPSSPLGNRMGRGPTLATAATSRSAGSTCEVRAPSCEVDVSNPDRLPVKPSNASGFGENASVSMLGDAHDLICTGPAGTTLLTCSFAASIALLSARRSVFEPRDREDRRDHVAAEVRGVDGERGDVHHRRLRGRVIGLDGLGNVGADVYRQLHCQPEVDRTTRIQVTVEPDAERDVRRGRGSLDMNPFKAHGGGERGRCIASTANGCERQLRLGDVERHIVERDTFSMRVAPVERDMLSHRASAQRRTSVCYERLPP